MKRKWEYAQAVFEADRYHNVMLKYSPWAGHRRFAYDLTVHDEPEMIVELGSFYGCSSFAFMQAVKDHGLETQMYAIDLWEAGDRYTLHDYEQDIYGFFQKVMTEQFAGIRAKMLKMSFDQANTQFENGCIDILHIDGSHAYEDVKHDFELWLPKMKQNGMILFHDISKQMLYGKPIGSSVFWNELKQQFCHTVQMEHSWGLGILFLSEEKYENFMKNVDLEYYRNLYLYDAEDCKDMVRKNYFALEDAKKWIDGLTRDKQKAEEDSARLVHETGELKVAYERTITEKDAYIQDLKQDLKKWEQENVKIRQDYEQTIQDKEAYILQLGQTIEECKQENIKIRRDYEQTIQGKETYIKELEQKIRP